MSNTLRLSFLASALALGLCACGPQRPAIDSALESGVTSSNGGGTRTVGNTNSINLGAGGGTTSPSNQAGRAY